MALLYWTQTDECVSQLLIIAYRSHLYLTLRLGRVDVPLWRFIASCKKPKSRSRKFRNSTPHPVLRSRGQRNPVVSRYAAYSGTVRRNFRSSILARATWRTTATVNR